MTPPVLLSLAPPPHGRPSLPLALPCLTSAPVLLLVSELWPLCPSDPGVLSQFTLILMGTGLSAADPSSFDFPRPSNSSCKTFDAQQICIGEKCGRRRFRPAGLVCRSSAASVVTGQPFSQTVGEKQSFEKQMSCAQIGFFFFLLFPGICWLSQYADRRMREEFNSG